MPVKSNIELRSGSLYFNNLDESVPVRDCEVMLEPEFVDDQVSYIKNSFEPVTLTCSNVEIPRGWVLTSCVQCGYVFPITEFYNILTGSSGWLCPRCTFDKHLKEIKKETNQ